MNTKTVFMGSPDFALPTLRALAENYPLVGVVTQPDKPAGRGRKLKSPPVKILAQELDLPIMQPRRLAHPDAVQQLRDLAPDLIVVAAFGQILRPEVLNLPKHGCINVHASLLPRWRGAAPINAAILHGDRESGITIMKMDAGLDSGPIINQRSIPIAANETAGSLFDRLAQLGANLLIETLPAYLSGELMPRPQDNTSSTYAPMLSRADGELDFNTPAETLVKQVRAFNPWPGTFIIWQKRRLKIHQAHAVSATTPGVGVFTTHEGFPAIGTSAGMLVLEKVQPAGKRAMLGDTFLHGAKNW
ncbi:MAG: methionyl-tRNA formyltransferase [Chloroflexota bacterium]|nr:methionyl-tRNA formyltransferase [Chloroflexota bacterium]